MMRKIELLAPAGNFDCLIAAVQNGADAVYISGKSFGARSFADNFDREDLERAVDYCHLRGVCVYVTVNTLIYDNEFGAAEDYLMFLNRIGVDALIVQDLGIIEIARKIIPDMPLHASTQMTIHNSYGVKELEKIGIKRVVLSRELSIDEIRSISGKTTAELEVFSHGALCMCYSGQCLMSSIIGGRSGNRGKCAQPCRLPYTVMNDNKKAFYMSLKDLCALEHIKTLKNIGVASLKIEGRMKGPAYVAAVVKIYRKYIDNPQKISYEDIELLDRIFNRGGLTDGYLTGNIGREMFAFDKPDNPYLKGNNDILKSLAVNEDTENVKMKLKCRVDIAEGQYPTISITDGETEIEYKHNKIAESALKQPLTAENVCMRLSKTGGTPFEFTDIDVSVEGNAFLTASDINSMRREALGCFEKAFLNTFKRKDTFNKKDFEAESQTTEREVQESGFVCEITNLEQFKAISSFEFVRFYVPIDLVFKKTEMFLKHREKTVLVLPAIMHEGEIEKYCNMADNLIQKGFCGVVVSNLDMLNRFPGGNTYGGFRLNIFNSRALKFLKKNDIVAAEISPELNLKKIRELSTDVPLQTMVYGRLPLMITENCVIKNGEKCPCDNNGYITDRMGMRFPIIRDGASCRNVILNCKKTFVKDKLAEIKDAGVSLYRIYFTDENPGECINICKAFLEGADYRPEDYTGAHFHKGAE